MFEFAQATQSNSLFVGLQGLALLLILGALTRAALPSVVGWWRELWKRSEEK